MYYIVFWSINFKISSRKNKEHLFDFRIGKSSLERWREREGGGREGRVGEGGEAECMHLCISKSDKLVFIKNGKLVMTSHEDMCLTNDLLHPSLEKKKKKKLRKRCLL